MSSAILLIAHGSRLAAANTDLVRVAELLRPRVAGSIVEVAYLELARPTIPTGLERCVKQGATSIKMLPYFLSSGAHVAEDLEELRRQFVQRHPSVTCLLCRPLGLHPKLIDVLLDRLNEAGHPGS